MLVESSQQVGCEKYENHLWKTDNQTLETCFIQQQIIDEPGFSISSTRDENIKGLWFDHNNKIFYFPENISEIFPNLLGLSAEKCSIKTIVKENFRGLSNLKYLWLTGNALEMIPSNAFEDLVSLETLHLRKVIDVYLKYFIKYVIFQL